MFVDVFAADYDALPPDGDAPPPAGEALRIEDVLIDAGAAPVLVFDAVIDAGAGAALRDPVAGIAPP